MRQSCAFLALAFALLIPSLAMAQGAASPAITAPADGQVLRGQVSITGTTDIPNFAAAELDFTYASDSTGTWFLIQTFSQPVDNSIIATWDTTSIVDGDYILRLRVTLQDGTYQDATVKVIVQNTTPTLTSVPTYTPTVTNTPMVTGQPPSPTSMPAAPTQTPPPVFATPTSLPPNSVEIQTSQIYSGIRVGALVIVGLFIFFGILIRLRRD